MIVLVLLVAVAIWKLPQRQMAPSRSTLEPKDYLQCETAVRSGLAQMLGGLVVLVGLFFTWRQLTTTGESLHVSQEGQLTGWYSTAIA